jgi:hypothetical protein
VSQGMPCRVNKNNLNSCQGSPGDTDGLTEKYKLLYGPFAAKSEFPTATGEGAEIMSLLGIKIPAELDMFSVARKGPGQYPSYRNYFDVTHGIIVAALNVNHMFFYIPDAPGSSKENPMKTKENSLQWNNIVAEQYKSLGGSLANLKHILQHDIVNYDTQVLIKQALNMNPTLPVVNGWTVVAPEGPSDDMFKALLGTDNGQGGGYMLKDYRTSMPGKSIQAIRVKEDDDGFSMITDYS